MRRYLCLLLVIWGLLGSVGVLGRIRDLRFYAYTSLASPILIVYTDSEGQQNMALRAQVSLGFEDGSRANFEFNKALYNKIVSQERSFNRHIVTLPYFAAIALLVDAGSSPQMRASILRYGFCRNGRMARYLNVKNEVRDIQVSFRSEGIPQKVPAALTLNCGV